MKVYLGLVVKNFEHQFNNFKSVYEQLKVEFPELITCVYEDNSTDNTKNLLKELSENNSNTFLISEIFDWKERSTIRTWDNKPCRIECIAYARNKLMELLESKGMGEDGDLCIMIDPDISKQFPVDKLIHCVKNFPADTDAIFANGVESNGNYYDRFAYRDTEFPFDFDIYGEQNMGRLDVKSKKVFRKITQKTTVLSAFAGIGIYKASSIKGCRYSAFPTKDLDDFYSKFIRENPCHPEVKIANAAQKNIQTHYRGSLLGVRLGSFFYYNCWGYNYPIVCEHVPFHISMMMKGRGNMYIEPSLTYYWN
jgi:hypothetical protein